MAILFEEFIEKSNKALSVDELLTVFLDTVKQHGYDKMIFCLMTDHKHIGLEAGVGHIRNYPSDWMKYYFEQGFEKIDPVITYSYQKLSTFKWSEIEERVDITRKQKLCLNLGIEAGLHNGVCTPLWGANRFAGVGLASTEKKDACDGNIDLIAAYAHHFYIAFQRLHSKNQKNNVTIPNIYLTNREIEILTKVAEGKSDKDIASIIGVTPHAIDFHMRSIYRKMQTNSRIYATTKAIALGLIHPILNPYIKV
ncbi:MAG: LuxR family transcriptional regulator [Pseudomonadota bacterium]